MFQLLERVGQFPIESEFMVPEPDLERYNVSRDSSTVASSTLGFFADDCTGIK